MAIDFQVTQDWKAAFPGACAGVLVLRNTGNPARDPELEKRKADLEARLRERYAGFDRPRLLALPELRAYDAYYGSFKKTYHIQLQLESIIFKGKSIPAVAALVEAMFMAEMEDLLLTAGHDRNALAGALTLDVSKGNEAYTLLRGDGQTLKAGDMFIRDGEGVISSVIYGPDRRTQIGPDTKDAVFTTYAPAGIPEESVKAHLEHIRDIVLCFAPQTGTEMLEVFHGPS